MVEITRLSKASILVRARRDELEVDDRISMPASSMYACSENKKQNKKHE